MPSAIIGLGGGDTSAPSGTFSDPWGSTSSASGGGGGFLASAPPAAPSGPSQLGRADISVSSPADFVGSFNQSAVNTDNLIASVTRAIFGPGTLLGGLPVISDIGKAFLAAPTGITQPKTAPSSQLQWGLHTLADLGAGIATRIPLPFDPASQTILNQQFNALPDSPLKQDYQKQIASSDPLITPHLQRQALLTYEAALQQDNAAARAQAGVTGPSRPSLFPGWDVPAATLGDAFTKLFGFGGEPTPVLQMPQRLVERVLAGGPFDRLQRLDNFASAGGQLNTAEDIALRMWRSKAWTDAQALDYLVASGAGMTGDPGFELAIQLGTDPLVFGSVGAMAAERVGVAGARLAAAEASLAERARTAQAAVDALRAESAPAAEIARAEQAAQEAATAAATPLRAGTPGGRFIGGPAGTEVGTSLIRTLSKPYVAIQDTSLGKAAGIARFIIDPFHAFSATPVRAAQSYDYVSRAAPEAMDFIYGNENVTGVLRWAEGAGNGTLAEALSQTRGTLAANLARRVALDDAQAGTIMARLPRDLLAFDPANEEMVKQLIANAPPDLVEMIKREVATVRPRLIDQAFRDNLAERMAAQFPDAGLSVDEYKAAIARFNDEQLSWLHNISYGRMIENHMQAVFESRLLHAGDQQALDYVNRSTLISSRTPTSQGVAGILSRLEKAKTLDEQIAIIKDAQARYDELVWGRPIRSVRDVQSWTSVATARLRDGTFPTQFTDAELKALPKMAEMLKQAQGTWTLGFMPEEGVRNGLRMDMVTGQWVRDRGVWAGYTAAPKAGVVAHNATVRELNQLGQTIGVGRAVRAVTKPVDMVEDGLRTLGTRVDGALITSEAKNKFLALAQQRGFPKADAEQVINAVIDRAGLNRTTIRGMPPADMWSAAAEFIPQDILLSGFTPRDLLVMLSKAWEGDNRFIGWSQKLTGRLKTMAAERTGTNIVGLISENLYQKIKFVYNVIFQSQEKIEPWVWLPSRGVTPAFGMRLGEADLAAQAMLARAQESGVLRMNDTFDIMEYQLGTLHMSQATNELVKNERGFVAAMTDVGGGKQLNMNRTFYYGLGRYLKPVYTDPRFEEAVGGLWQKTADHLAATYGHVPSDDAIAASIINGNFFANDFEIPHLVRPGSTGKALVNAIAQANWTIPQDIGRLPPLETDLLGRYLGRMLFVKGKPVGSFGALARGIRDETVAWQDVQAILENLGVHPDYIRRFEGAVRFDYARFWQQARETYQLSNEEMGAMQGFIERAAHMRGLTPTEFLSQVVHPFIGSGDTAKIANLADGVSVLRAPLRVEGEAGFTAQDLAAQLADIFQHHLDPSGRAYLLEKWAGRTAGAEARKAIAMTPDELAAYKAEGQAIYDALPTTTQPLKHYAANVDKVAGELQGLALGGGATYDAKTGAYLTIGKSRGFGVGGAGGAAAKIISEAEARDPAIFRATLEQFIRDNEALLGRPNHYVGLWNDAGQVYFDVTVRTMNAGDALRMAANFDQQSIVKFRTGEFPRPPGLERPWTQDFAKALLDYAQTGKSDDVDASRLFEFYKKWVNEAIADGLFGGQPSGPVREVLRLLAPMPTQHAASYNVSQHLLIQQVQAAMRAKMDDAFRLAYFARSRTVFERGLNHPVLAFYPASYMWGKVLPEMVRFIAKEPFGLQTGALAYALNDVQLSLAAQRELDPKWSAMLDKVGKSEAVFFAGYMLPTQPFTAGASLPIWLRNIATQAQANQDRVDRGLKPKPLDIATAVAAQGELINPLRPINIAARSIPLEDVLTTIVEKAQKATSGKPAVTTTTAPTTTPQLSATLEEQMNALRDVLKTSAP